MKVKLTRAEKSKLTKHMKNLSAAQDFFMELEAKYEGDGEPVDGEPVGPLGDAAESLSQIQMEFCK